MLKKEPGAYPRERPFLPASQESRIGRRRGNVSNIASKTLPFTQNYNIIANLSDTYTEKHYRSAHMDTPSKHIPLNRLRTGRCPGVPKYNAVVRIVGRNHKILVPRERYLCRYSLLLSSLVCCNNHQGSSRHTGNAHRPYLLRCSLKRLYLLAWENHHNVKLVTCCSRDYAAQLVQERTQQKRQCGIPVPISHNRITESRPPVKRYRAFLVIRTLDVARPPCAFSIRRTHLPDTESHILTSPSVEDVAKILPIVEYLAWLCQKE